MDKLKGKGEETAECVCVCALVVRVLPFFPLDVLELQTRIKSEIKP